MKKRFIAVILAIILIFSAVMLISGCNKDDEGTVSPNESTDAIGETEPSTEEPSGEETESTSGEKETEKQTEKPTETESETKETTPSQTEPSTNNDEPVTCDSCGNVILSDSHSGDIAIGDYCDGYCDEWFSY